jgi:hypothetical protein
MEMLWMLLWIVVNHQYFVGLAVLKVMYMSGMRIVDQAGIFVDNDVLQRSVKKVALKKESSRSKFVISAILTKRASTLDSG